MKRNGTMFKSILVSTSTMRFLGALVVVATLGLPLSVWAEGFGRTTESGGDASFGSLPAGTRIDIPDVFQFEIDLRNAVPFTGGCEFSRVGVNAEGKFIHSENPLPEKLRARFLTAPVRFVGTAADVGMSVVMHRVSATEWRVPVQKLRGHEFLYLSCDEKMTVGQVGAAIAKGGGSLRY